jgi:hypothetical protein
VRSFLVVICLFISTVSFAQFEIEKSVSLDIPAKQASDAKPYLLHAAVIEVIKASSKELGIDGDDFKLKQEGKFEAYFIGYKERKILEKFGKDYSTNLTEDQKKSFYEGLDNHRQNEFIKYSKLDRLLDSYAFRQISHDPAVGWKAVILLNLNTAKTQKHYSRLLSNEVKQYSNLLILTEVTPMGFGWTDLGLEKSQSFTGPMATSWQTWFSNNHPDNVEEISVCNEECYQDFSEWQLIPQEEGMTIPEHLLNALWLKVSFNLRKVSYTPGINEWEFEWDGSLVLLDVNTKKNLYSYTMRLENKVWRGLDQKSLNSALVSSMYRSALDALSKVSRKILDTPRLNHLGRLIVQGQRHMGDVLLLIDLLKKEGSKIGLELSPDLFTRNEAQLLCFYQGEEKSFTDLLSQVKELKSSQSYRLVNEFTGIHHVLKLVAE